MAKAHINVLWANENKNTMLRRMSAVTALELKINKNAKMTVD